MRAVWSHWHAPFTAHKAATWGSELSHLLAWVLSFENARRHFPETMLVTDEAGAALLVDGLGLEFDTVSLGLEALRDVDPGWWTMGKLVAIAEQKEPFLHLDADVFLWRPLPAALNAAPLFAQNPEPYDLGHTYYRPEELAQGPDGFAWLPEEWGWHRRTATPRGECCGILGGRRVDFLHHFARQGLRVLRDPGNRQALAALTDARYLTVTLEQYLLAACVEHHCGRAGSPYRDIAIAYLFPSWKEAGDPAKAAALGYTHLIADTKRDPAVADRLRERVRRDYPHRFRRAMDLANASGQRAEIAAIAA